MPSSIINSDDGVVSGTSGLKSVGGDDGVLVFQSKGTETARINTDKQIVAAAGTNSLPALTTTGDLNTGIFFPAADTIGFVEGGAEAMRIDSSGNVLVGTSNSRAVTAGTSTGWNPRLQVTKTGVNAANIAAYSFSTFTSDLGGGLGIGPDIILARSNNDTEGGQTAITNNMLLGRITFNGSDGTSFQAGALIAAASDGQTWASNDCPTRLVFFTTPDGSSSPTERARITSGGYFKASNTGSYDSAAGAYHEFRQTADNVTVYPTATNASYSNAMILPVCNRSQNSAYSFMRCFSNSGTDTEFLLRGDGDAFADGTWNNNGADYAEFFESANGQALTLGATVILDGNKVREATEQDPASAIIGVVRPKEPSKASMIIGNTAWNKWANKYLSDDFDRYIMEDHDVVEWEETITDEEGNTSTKSHSYESHRIPEGITVPADATIKTHDDKGNKFQHYKLNPAWDKDAEYVNRENRPEWNIIGLVGQVKVLKGQPTNDRWIKMRDVSETVEEWFIR
jgi:hypothetical protein